jgi:hypothetical protein
VSGAPRTSSPALVELFTALGLEVSLEPTADASFEAVLTAVADWYAEPARAAAARVYLLSFAADAGVDDVFTSASWVAFKLVLAQWLRRPLPQGVEGEELLMYVADALLITGAHASLDPAAAPQLLRFDTPRGDLYLLRAEVDRRQVDGEGWLPGTNNSPDTEAALNGGFRVDGCSLAFTEHAPTCPRCLANLERADHAYGLPEDWAHLRTWPEPSHAPALPPIPELHPESGVAIHIPRSGPRKPAPARPWWRFW